MIHLLNARSSELLELYAVLLSEKQTKEKAYGEVSKDLATIEFQLECVADEILQIDRQRKLIRS